MLDDEHIAVIEADWRQRCRADPLVSRGRQPPEGTELVAVVGRRLQEASPDLDALGHEVTAATSPRLSSEEALRQLALLGDAFLDALPDDPEIGRRLVRCAGRAFEATAVAFVTRSETEARRDALTGLLNVAAYSPDARRAVDRAIAGQGSLAIVNFDLNGFSVVNNEQGHAAGNAYLKRFAALASASLRALGGQVYRMGGDEFVGLIRDVKRAAVEGAIMELSEQPQCPPLSFGVSHAPADLEVARALPGMEGQPDTLALAELADIRMYEMKNARTPEERADRTKRWLEGNPLA